MKYIIGHYYLRPHIKIIYVSSIIISDLSHRYVKKPFWMPILHIKPHNDGITNSAGFIQSVENKQDTSHYHIDYRFCSNILIEHYVKNVSIKEDYAKYLNSNIPLIINKFMTKNEILYRKSKCISGHNLNHHYKAISIIKQQMINEGKKLRGNICPHQGYNLANEPSIGGCIVCPMHSLKWNCLNGELVV